MMELQITNHSISQIAVNWQSINLHEIHLTDHDGAKVGDSVHLTNILSECVVQRQTIQEGKHINKQTLYKSLCKFH